MNNALQRFAEESAKHIQNHFMNNSAIMDFVKDEATAHLAKTYGVSSEQVHVMISRSKAIAKVYDDLVMAGLVGCYIAVMKMEV